MDHKERSGEPTQAVGEDVQPDAADEAEAGTPEINAGSDPAPVDVGENKAEVTDAGLAAQAGEPAPEADSENVDGVTANCETEAESADETTDENVASAQPEAASSADPAEEEGLDLAAVYEEQPLERILEAMIASTRGSLSIDRIITALGEHAPEKTEVREALSRLVTDCESRSVELKETASGFRFQVRQDFAPWIARLSEEKPQRYSRAALETLALIAYRQPITRGEIEQVRGVAVSTNIIRTLEERNWVRVVGHKDVPGRPALFATTRDFLDYFGMQTLTELPSLEAVKDLDALGEKLAEMGHAGTDAASATDPASDAAPAAELIEQETSEDLEMPAMFVHPEADHEPHELSVGSAVEAAMALDIGMSLESEWEPDEFQDDEINPDSAFLIGQAYSPMDASEYADETVAEVIAEKPSEPIPG